MSRLGQLPVEGFGAKFMKSIVSVLDGALMESLDLRHLQGLEKVI
jgi:hypothetical protein